MYIRYLKSFIFFSIFFAVHFIYSMRVVVFNVGQGNCTLLVHPTERAVLVDAGSVNYPSNKDRKKCIAEIIESIRTHVKSRQLSIVISHGHSDHYNLLPFILPLLQKDGFIMDILLGGSKEDYNVGFTALLDKCLYSIKYVNDFPQDRRMLETFLPSYCSILSAAYSTPHGNKNDTSIVLKAAYDGIAILLPGDATSDRKNFTRTTKCKSTRLSC